MGFAGAIIFLPREGGEAPLLLQKLLFQPGALWLAKALEAHGYGRFLVVCHEDDRSAVAHCFPTGSEYITEGSADAAERLSAFLSHEEGAVAVITRPVLVPFPAAGAEGEALPLIPPSALACALDSGADFAAALRELGRPAGPRAILLADGPDADHEAIARRIGAGRLRAMGARLMDMDRVYADPTVSVGAGTVLLPGVILRGNTVIGRDCEIGPDCMIADCTLGDRVTVNSSQLNESTVGQDAKIGPFAYIRPHCHVGPDVKVGDFVELKNSTVGAGTKISHLTYVGDSDVGQGVNFGCGTVTVNYDGAAKFRTTIGDGAFIGCNTNLVAPVSVGAGAYTAAGSTITDDVPDDSLAIARSVQVIKKQWALRRRKRNQ